MDCTKHEAVEAEIKQLKEDVKNIFDRIRPLEDSKSRTEEIVKSLLKAVDDLASNIDKQIDALNDNVDKRITDLALKVEALKAKPGERLERFVWILIAAAVGYFMKK